MQTNWGLDQEDKEQLLNFVHEAHYVTVTDIWCVFSGMVFKMCMWENEIKGMV